MRKKEKEREEARRKETGRGERRLCMRILIWGESKALIPHSGKISLKLWQIGKRGRIMVCPG